MNARSIAAAVVLVLAAFGCSHDETGGSGHACAETTTIKASCWGSNADGELGTGSTAPTA